MRKSVILTDKLLELADEIKEKRGYPSFTAVVHAGIMTLHSEIFPKYIRPLARDEDVEDKINRKKKEAKMKKEYAKSEYRDIALELEGEIFDEKGVEYVRYFTYSGTKRFEQVVPLTQMSTDLIATQYQPSRAKVEQLQAEGKTAYEKNT